ncbi:MAG: zinc ABC transporter substrate-binding protein, partial [Bacillota bacterium]|nr:zinc ABC transporter substrate-binding protein [Bacillota bacterium]
MRNKKVMSRSKMILVLLLALTYVLVGCTGGSNTTTSPVQMENQTSSSAQDAGQKIKIVTTIFPPYDFAKAIGGDKVEVVMLLSPGMESHTYEPTPADIKLISSADLFIHAGSENDTWVESVVPENVKRLEMMSHVNVLMETHDHHHHDHDHDHDHGHNHGHDHGDGHNHGEHDHESTSSTSQGEGSTGGEGEGH